MFVKFKSLMTLPLITIIGRPNVGKSTLFNCFAKSQKAIVSDIPGTTRDTAMEKIEGDNYDYWLVDTAGLRNEKGETLEEEIQTQAKLALENADIILFLIDGKAPITLEDQNIITQLRKSQTPVIFIANKIDDGQTDSLLELAQFGLGVPLSISAKNYTGMWELEDAIEDQLEALKFEKKDAENKPKEEKDSIKVALIGRPNVGKSSLFNTIIGSKRAIVSNIAGTTRDSIDSEYTDETGQKFLFLDTAGLKRAGRIGKDIDFWSSVRSQRSIEMADVCILLIDSLDGVTHQDLVLAGKIIKAGKGIIIGVNKFDLVREKSGEKEETDERELDEVKMWGEKLDTVRKNYWHYLHQKMTFLSWAPVLFFSAQTKKGISDIFPSLKGIYQERQKRISTAELNRFVPEVYYGHITPMVGTKKGTIKYATQADTMPPKFIFFVNNSKAFHFSYRRYLENKLREKYGFHGTPIQLEIKDAMEGQEKKRKKKK